MTTVGPTMIPSPIPDRATPGEKRVWTLLRSQLPSSYIVWYELTLSLFRKSRYPDFVLVGPDQGILVLEVKDWVLTEISEVRRTLFVLRQRELRERDPFRQARENALLVNDILQRSDHPALVHQSGPHQGKLQFPYRHAVVLTNLARADVAMVNGFSDILENEPVLLQDDLGEDFAERLLALRSEFKAPMTPDQINAVRWVLYPETRIPNRKDKVLDLQQDGAMKSHLSEEAERALSDPQARLLRGPAGSGKSLVLIRRALMEAGSRSNWRVLVLTYNRPLSHYLEYLAGEHSGSLKELPNLEITNFHRWCRRALESIGDWHTPVSTKEQRSLIREAVQRAQGSLRLSDEFVFEEISWMKQNEITVWDAYKVADRRGRGMGLTESHRARLFQVFDHYCRLLGDRLDWDDVALRVLRAMQRSLLATGSYEAVFVDEAQDFAPSWLHVVRLLVNPMTSVLFLAADSTQRIYQRGFSWKNLGLSVAGRTIVLSKRYRNPPAVQSLSYDLIKDDVRLREQLADSGEELIEPEIGLLNVDDLSPIVFQRFSSEEREHTYVTGEISRLLMSGYQCSGIAVFHRYAWGVEKIGDQLREAGIPVTCATEEDIVFTEDKVRVCTLHKSKGLEFPVVFLCGLDRINYGLRFAPREPELRELWTDEWLVNEKTLLYVGVTRSTERLYLTCHGLLPGFAAPLEHASFAWGDSRHV